MAASPPPTVRVLDKCRVNPSGDGIPAPGVLSLPFTFFDILWVGDHPVERLFFYNWPVTTADFVASALPRLKHSLSATLRHYYPLAGTLRYNPGCDEFEIHCTEGDSVAFTLAECVDGNLLQLAGDHPRALDTLLPLVPEIPASGDDAHGGRARALMALQVTVFPGAGVCIGVSIQHAVCDGTGFTRFMKSWAAACRRPSEDTNPPAGELPLIDRTLVSDPNGLYRFLWNDIKSLQGGEMLSHLKVSGPEIVRSTFLLRRTHVESLRQRVSESKPGPFRYSSFVLTGAYVWVCLLKAAEQPLQDGDVSFCFVMDCRSRLRPQLPATYFGNCIGVRFVDARRSDLVGEGGVGCAAAAIAESIARLEEEDVMEGANEWISKAKERAPRRPLSIAGSPRFGVYGVDFGWGRPLKVEVVGIEKTGAMSLAESREEEGGIEIGLALPAAVMARFGSLFAAGLLQDPPSQPADC